LLKNIFVTEIMLNISKVRPHMWLRRRVLYVDNVERFTIKELLTRDMKS